jgi:hypothetical protein
MEKKIKRPPRLFINKKGHRYVKLKGKRMKIDSKLSNKNLVKVVINNMSQEKKIKRRIRKPLLKANHSLRPPEATSSSMNNLIVKNLNDELQKLKNEKKNLIENNKTPTITEPKLIEEKPPKDKAFVMYGKKKFILDKNEVKNIMEAKNKLEQTEAEKKKIKKEKDKAEEELRNREAEEKRIQKEEQKKRKNQEYLDKARKELDDIKKKSHYKEKDRETGISYFFSQPKNNKFPTSKNLNDKTQYFQDSLATLKKSHNAYDNFVHQKLTETIGDKPISEILRPSSKNKNNYLSDIHFPSFEEFDKTFIEKKMNDFENEEPNNKEEEQEGEGIKLRGNGLWNDEIDEIMEPFKNEGFLGTISSDEIKTLIPKIKKNNKYSFIMNLSKKKDKGTHWIAVYIDPIDDMTLEYYDSLAQPPTKQFQEDIKYLIDKLKPDTYLKFKINKIKKQSDSTDTCGWMAIKFLEDRYNGIDFKDSTGYNDVKTGEKEANELKKSVTGGFGYI